MADYDGDLSNVNPELLKLCASAEDWREQRRRAMKAKIFGTGPMVSPLSEGEACLTTDRSVGPSPSPELQISAASCPAQHDLTSQQTAESYILQQILSHKRRRDEVTTQPASASASASQPHHQPPMTQQQQQQPQITTPLQCQGLSLKEKLLRRYRRD
ncbi:hypothetical protein JKF63_00032 [Porcisia hertigi]|uniref:Uncharacterized protein n=1 Tax=Porcisia hertigi TaxID=2761500 RepID=A0A836HSW4_9TRYP|nr:hypothetical protein JKF63_00032 [Porcisia hertigi]